MKVVLSSNPYRDRGLRAALEARDILTRAGAELGLTQRAVEGRLRRLRLRLRKELGGERDV